MLVLILIYIASLAVFCIATWIVPLVFAPLVWTYRAIMKKGVLPPTHLVMLLPFVVGTLLLIYCTEYVWSLLGYHIGWLFPVLIAVVHLLFGVAKGATPQNQAQAYSVVCGVILYALLRLLL